MRDVDRDYLESLRPRAAALPAINHCLSCLMRDEQHSLPEKVVEGLSYEELIGTLLVARELAQDAARTGSYD